jgi:hypothetical protein
MQIWPGRHALHSSVQVVGSTVCMVSGEELGAVIRIGIIISFGYFRAS